MMTKHGENGPGDRKIIQRPSSFQMNNYRYLMYSIILTVIGFGLWIGFEDHEKIFSSIRLIGWSGFVFVCLFSLVNYFIRYLRWQFLLRLVGDRPPFGDGLLCYISGYALTTTPAKAGEAIRCLYFNKRHGVNYPHALAAILSERTSDAIAAMILATIAIYSFEDFRWLGLVLAILIASIILLINKPALIIHISTVFRIFKISWLNKILDMVPLFIQRSATLLSLKSLGIGTLFAVISWSAEAYAFAWLVQELGGHVSTMLYMSIFAIGMIAGAVTFLPGGLGSAELVMVMLLVITGMGKAEALTATLLCRLATLWFAVGLGLLCVWWLEHNLYSAETKL